jgi:hypothetical protein
VTLESTLPPSPENEGWLLLAEYKAATRFFTWTVSEPSRQRGMVTHEDFDKLLKGVEEARAECERARQALSEFRDLT